MSRAQPLRVADYLKHIVEAVGNIHEREPQKKLLQTLIGYHPPHYGYESISRIHRYRPS